MRTLVVAVSVPLALLLSAGTLNAQNADATMLKWGPAPPVFPAGAQMAVVSGDPGKAGPFVVQFKFPNGYKIAPHSHPTDENLTVLSGTFMVGMGDKMDMKKAKPMAVGDSGTMKAGANHYAEAKGATTVRVSSQGPFAMTYVNPKDMPKAAMSTAKTGGY